MPTSYTYFFIEMLLILIVIMVAKGQENMHQIR